MNRLVILFVLFALLGIACADELLSREKRQNRYFGGSNNYRPNRPSYGGGNNNYRPNRPSYGGGNNNYRPNRPSYGGGNNNYRPNRPGFGGGNNNYRPNRPSNNGGSGLNFNIDLGRPGRPVTGNQRPHHPAIPALFNALLENAQNNNNYGPATESPVFVYQPNGPNNRPAFAYISENTQIAVRNKQKKS